MPSEQDPRWRQYATALLRIGAAPVLEVDLSLPLSRAQHDRLRELGLGRGFGVVTAANPAGRLATSEANRAAQEALRVQVARNGLVPVRADGYSRDERHYEPGFAVPFPRHECIALARRFRQLALYWYDGEAFSIVGAIMEAPDVRLPAE